MVKPALPYLDIIADAKELAPDHPLACYQVSGEYAMIHAGASAGVYDLRTMAFESVESMVRAGKYTSLHKKLHVGTNSTFKALPSFCLTSRLSSWTGWMYKD